MRNKAPVVYLTILLLSGLAVTLSACGWATGSQASPAGSSKNLPERVEITINFVVSPDGQQKKPTVQVSQAGIVQQLYKTTTALPEMPKDIACTQEMGPSYQLTFYNGAKKLLAATAEHYGCRVTHIANEKNERQASAEFWTLVDKAIYQGTPPTQPTLLSIVRPSLQQQPAQVARISDRASIQRLYDAIIQLPSFDPINANCQTPTIDYDLSFQAPDHLVAASFQRACNRITLVGGNYQSRSGTYKTDPKFVQFFTKVIAQATFAPARPAHMNLDLTSGDTSSYRVLDDSAKIQKLYTKFLALTPIQPPPNCPSEEDKAAQKGSYYRLNFIQWDMSVLKASAYEGSCKQVLVEHTVVQNEDKEFWDLLHQVTGSK